MMRYHTVPSVGRKSDVFTVTVLRHAMSAVVISELLNVRRMSKQPLQTKKQTKGSTMKGEEDDGNKTGKEVRRVRLADNAACRERPQTVR